MVLGGGKIRGDPWRQPNETAYIEMVMMMTKHRYEEHETGPTDDEEEDELAMPG